MNIYLAGYISGKKLDECLAWRKKIRQYFDLKPKWHGEIAFLDPLNGKKFGEIDAEGLKSNIPGKAFVKRDYKCVKIADLLIVNLNTFGESRPLTGTIYELAWAWLHKIPVIVITTDVNYLEHPFIKDTACIIVSSVEEILEKDYIEYYYKGLVSAEY